MGQEERLAVPTAVRDDASEAPKLKAPTAEEIRLNKINADKFGVPGSAPHTPSTKKMNEVLPEHPAAKDGFVTLGCLKIEASAYDKFREAMIYEGKNPEMTAKIESLVKGPRTTEVTTIATPDNEMVPQASGDAKVHWDPNHMHIASNGARRSPATRLAHELDHADEWTHNPQRLLLNARTPDKNFGNLEEKRVITGFERRQVHVLGEGIRNDHDFGKGNFEVKGVTQTTPVLHQTRDGVTTDLSEGYKQTGKILSADKDSVTQDIGHGKTVSYPRAEFEGLVGTTALQGALNSGKPMTVSVKNHEFDMKEPLHEVSRGR